MALDLVVLNGLASVFGGCCANVLSLEALMKDKGSNMGTLVTFTQFLFVTLSMLPQFVTVRNGCPTLKSLHVPLRVYILSVVLFYISSSTNNSVFKYNISIPLHIVFRCFSSVITMVVCWLVAGKRYSKLQVVSTVFLTAGAIITSLYRDHEISLQGLQDGLRGGGSAIPTDSTFAIGICLLVVSSISSSLLSVYNEWTYKTYGKFWQENMFYTHFLSLPIFLVKDGSLLRSEIHRLAASRGVYTLVLGGNGHTLRIPRQWALLATNVLTQHVCIRGVNILASHTNALTLSFILTVRKFASLLLSVAIYKSAMSRTAYCGVALVFVGTLLYAVGSRRPQASDTTTHKTTASAQQKE